MKRLLFFFAFLLVAVPCQAGIIYVDADAPPGGNGQTWATAYKCLQDALVAAQSGDQIWVAAGTYYPDEDEGANVDPNDRTETFQLINGVGIYGGFAGWETSREQRNWQAHETILNGDINTPVDNSDNSYHVVNGTGTEPNAVLDGFTITAGNANGAWPNNSGGGMYNNEGSNPTVANCTFTRNSAEGAGGGMSNLWSSNPTLTNCTFNNNKSTGGSGGGMNNYKSDPNLTNCTFSGNSATSAGGVQNGDSSPTLTNCTFSGNSATQSGGGMYNTSGSSPTLTNCTFSGNSAGPFHWGGGMVNGSSSPIVNNCIFSSNSAGRAGGGMANERSSPTVTDCTFNDNSAGSGAGLYNADVSSPNVVNCTFIRNSAKQGGGMFSYESSSPTVVGCTFNGNQASDWGGGLENGDGNPTISNCTFVRNSAVFRGGAIINMLSSPTLTNCTFYGNSAGESGGGMYNYDTDPNLTNCILWGNTAPNGSQIFDYGTSSAIISYSDVEGGWPGTENIDEDPLFIDPNGLDGITDTADDEEGYVHLRGWSPCINAGDPGGDYSGQVDIDNQPRVAYGRVDMGADEVFPIAGDIDTDEDVDFVDFAYFADHWLEGIDQ